MIGPPPPAGPKNDVLRFGSVNRNFDQLIV